MKIKLLDHKYFDGDFPYSALEVFDNRLYFLASNGEEILRTNNKWKAEDKLAIKKSEDGADPGRITTILKESRNSAFLLFASRGQDNRHTLVRISAKARETERIDLTDFLSGIQEIVADHFEVLSATTVNDKIVLLVRNGDQRNLIITNGNFYRKQDNADVVVSRLQWEENEQNQLIPTAIHYSYKNDWLIVTGERRQEENDTEENPELSLGIVEHAFRKIDRKRLKINESVTVAVNDGETKGLHTRSIVAQEDKEGKLKMHMIRTDFQGKTSLVKLRIKIG